MSTSRDQCCYFTLQNEMVAALLTKLLYHNRTDSEQEQAYK